MTKRTPLIIGNWKTNKKVDEVYEFLHEIQGKLPNVKQVQVGVAAQDVYLHEMVKYSESLGLPIGVFAENVHWADDGSYTGETSPAALADIGVTGSIVGHYERRKMFKETNGSVGLKVSASLRNGLTPIVAIAEDTTRYNPDDVEMAPLTEIAVALAGVEKSAAHRIVIAYEPAWAIGATEAPSSEIIEHSGRVIRQSLAILFSQDVADKIRIQYGGSVTPDNAKSILNLPDIDGLLIGRASLEPAAFLKMVNAATEG
ncbi:triosephosphate isomerase [Weissella viridescens]|uniref:Triosephosphate isomerase n=1 Tax=Weissella viridescens TaxID=1629 RepID=A0A0R2HBT9_WEIVI|nr:triose-phosphate isomerase [Weissella viridescens]KRN46909.1 triosephosphate isomerase [Weissella viridescens]GEA94252.1 triosephosphate isomerase [Weissella viridescens]